jgi:hypothetical protein
MIESSGFFLAEKIPGRRNNRKSKKVNFFLQFSRQLKL